MCIGEGQIASGAALRSHTGHMSPRSGSSERISSRVAKKRWHTVRMAVSLTASARCQGGCSTSRLALPCRGCCRAQTSPAERAFLLTACTPTTIRRVRAEPPTPFSKSDGPALRCGSTSCVPPPARCLARLLPSARRGAGPPAPAPQDKDSGTARELETEGPHVLEAQG